METRVEILTNVHSYILSVEILQLENGKGKGKIKEKFTLQAIGNRWVLKDNEKSDKPDNKNQIKQKTKDIQKM